MSRFFLRSLAFFLFVTLSFEQIAAATPSSVTFNSPLSVPRPVERDLARGGIEDFFHEESNILTFPVHVAHYALQGDWKGLFKYMGQMALQVVMIALMFIPGVGQALGALFQFLGNFLQFAGGFLVGLGSFLGQALSFIPFAGQLLGGIVRGALHFAGGFLQGLGSSLVQIGRSMIQKSNEIFRNLREQGFKYVRDSLTSGFKKLVNQLNPVTYYKNLYGTVTESLHKLGLKGSLAKLLDWAKDQLLVNFVQEKIDQALEKSKMNSFLKGVLSTVSRAGIEGMVSHLFPRDLSLPRPEPVIIEGPRPPPPTNEPGFFERLLTGFGQAIQTLRDTAGRIKSIFISDSSSDSLSPALEEELPNYTAELGTDSEGNPSFYKPLGTNAQIEYRPESLGETPSYTRFDLDAGELQFFRHDPQTRLIGKGERVGNLETKPSFVQSLRTFADQADSFIDNTTDPLLNLLGGPLGSEPGLALFLGREYAQGLVDTLRFGDQFGAIRSDFQSGLASFRQGDYLDSAKSFGSAGLRGLVEGGRILNLLPAVGLATRTARLVTGVGQSTQRARILTNLAESQAARNASRFSLEGFNDGIEISRRDALKLLQRKGIDTNKARDFINSFEGPLSVRRATPEEAFNRFTPFVDDRGRFLTKDSFSHPSDAILELVLDPKRNNARFLQTVTPRGNPIVIEGRIRGSFTNRKQYLIDWDDFDFSQGRRYEN